MDRTSLDWAHLFKNGLSAVIKLPGVMMPFLIVSVLNAVVTSFITDVFKQMF